MSKMYSIKWMDVGFCIETHLFVSKDKGGSVLVRHPVSMEQYYMSQKDLYASKEEAERIALLTIEQGIRLAKDQVEALQKKIREAEAFLEHRKAHSPS